MGLKRGRTGRNKNTISLPKIGKRKVKSQFEYDIYKSLCGIVHGASVEYETEKLDYTTTSSYTPDLIVRGRDGSVVYIETKGFFPYVDRAKMVSVKEQHPELDIRICFYRDTPASLGRGNKMKPTEWALKYGFPSCVKEIPLDWFGDNA